MAASPASLTRFYLLLAGLALAGGGVLFYLSTRPSTPGIPVAVTVQPSDTAGFRGYVLGPDSGAVEILEYADYQCPACQTFDLVEFPYVRDRLIATGRVRYIYKDFPLDRPHRWARLAAHAAACADEQGKFWELHGELYRTQPDWSVSGDAGGMFQDLARGVGLDAGAYDTCMRSVKYAGRIQATMDEGVRAGVGSTPTFLIAGRLYPGVQAYDRLRAIVDSLSAAR
jgi:protein-disulfide isomerase